MRKYLAFFRLKFTSGLQYRAAALAGLTTQLFFGIMFIMVYMAFYSSGTNSNLSINLKEVITYLWLQQMFLSLIFIWHKDGELLKMIKDGNIAYELCRPQNIYIMWYIRILSTKLSALILRALPLLGIVLLLPSPYNLSLPYSFESLIFFIISLVLATFLVTGIATILHILICFTIDERGIISVISSIGAILAGQVVPVPLLPNILSKIAYILPFAYVNDFSFRIYSGNIIGQELLIGLLIQIMWIIIILLTGLLLSNKIMKRVVIQGG